MKKRIAGIALAILCMFTMPVFSIKPAAGTVASAYWVQNASSDWYMNKPGAGMVQNAWVQDTDSSWYYLDSSGKVLSGIVIDGGHAYILQPEHDGYYGRMVCSIEPMTVNGRTVVFNNMHNGTYGEIISIDGKTVSGNTDFSSLGMPIHMAENPQIEYVSSFTCQGCSGSISAGSTGTNIPGRVVPAASPSVAEPKNDVPVASPSDAGSGKKEKPEEEGPKNNLFDDGVRVSWKGLQSPYAGNLYGYNANAITDKKIGNEAFRDVSTL